MARGRKKFAVEEACSKEVEYDSFYFRIVLDFKVFNENAHDLAYNGMIEKYVDLVAKALSTNNVRFLNRNLMTSPFPFSEPNLEMEEHRSRLK